MSSYAKRLVFAALFSVLGMACSYSWYRHDLNKSRGSGEAERKLVARLDTAKNEVQKRSVKRVIWQRVQEEEPLYSGEAIRTATDGEAKIIFESGTELDLDPDSVVVIEDAGDKLSLDFVKGNLVVKGNDKTSDLSLKSGNTTISLNDADLALGKGAGKDVDVQVIRGLAEVTNGSKTQTLDKEKSGTIDEKGMNVIEHIIKMKSPRAEDRVYTRIDDKNGGVQFTWSPLSDDYKVQLETGVKREALKATGAEVSGAKGALSMVMKPGTQYWRLVATNAKNPKLSTVTPTSKIVVVAEIPCRLLSPAERETVAIVGENQKIDLRWANPSKLTGLKLQVARDSEFKKPLIDEAVEDTGAYSFEAKEAGGYFWRVIATKLQGVASLSSEVHRFELKNKFELVSPEMKSPAADAEIPLESFNNGSTFFTWRPVEGVDKFRVHIDKVNADKGDGLKGADISAAESNSAIPSVSTPTSLPIFDKQVNQITEVRAPALEPGIYRWFVVAIDKTGKESKETNARKFRVGQVPNLAWADNRQQQNYFYVTPTPTMKAQWLPNAKLASAHYKVTVKAADGSPDKVLETDKFDPLIDVAKDGLYHVSVEAFDANGHISARSGPRDFVVAAQPLLEPPQFATRMPATVQALNNGSASFTWAPVNGAKAYALFVKDSGGKTIRSEKALGATTFQVKSLLPGNYKVSVAAIDAWGRSSSPSSAKSLVVPDTSDAPPPTFKRINIK